MAEIKTVGNVEVIMDFSLNVPMGHVFIDGVWYTGAIKDNSKEIDIEAYKAKKQEEYNVLHPAETPTTTEA